MPITVELSGVRPAVAWHETQEDMKLSAGPGEVGARARERERRGRGKCMSLTVQPLVPSPERPEALHLFQLVGRVGVDPTFFGEAAIVEVFLSEVRVIAYS
jgi:hypothetical protein